MPGGEWRSLFRTVAIGFACLAFATFVLFAGYFIGRSAGAYDAEANGYAAQYQSSTQKRVRDCFGEHRPPTASARCVEEAIRAGHDEKRAESDLNAQRQMADWAWWLLIITMIQTPITLVGIVLLLRNIQQADAANEISREDRRPILAFDGIRWAEFHGPSKQLAQFTWKNAGQRPARLISLDIGREETEPGQQLDFAALLRSFEAKQRDAAGLIVMPEGRHFSTPIMVSNNSFDGVDGRHDVYLLARAVYANALAGEHERDFSTSIAVRIFPQVDVPRPSDLPEHVEWDPRRAIIMGHIPGPIVGYEMAGIDSRDAVNMT